MPKFKVRFVVDNPNSLYCDKTITAESKEEALEIAEDVDLDNVHWKTSEGNFVDVSDVTMEILE